MKRALAVLVALGGALGPAVAQAFNVAEVIAPRPLELRGGETRNAVIEVVVKPGYRVQANPAAQPNLIPTALTLASAPGVAVGTPHYPAPKRLRLTGSGDELLVYDRRFVIVVPITHAQRGTRSLRLEGSLRYQGCDDRHCFFPRTGPFTLVVCNSAGGRQDSPNTVGYGRRAGRTQRHGHHHVPASPVTRSRAPPALPRSACDQASTVGRPDRRALLVWPSAFLHGPQTGGR